MLALGLVSVSHADGTPPGSMTRQQRDAVCTKCHDESETKPILSIYQTPHGAIGDTRTPACQDCHGESLNHLNGAAVGGKKPSPDRIFGRKSSSSGYPPISPKEQNEACLACHKAGLRMHWPGSKHDAADVACTSCHVIHSPTDPVRIKDQQPAVCFQCHREKRAEINKISAHPIAEGKMACSDCHNPHGSSGPHLLKQNTVNETCWQCHADKRGPFLWEHQPVTEDCTNCHNPHGSNITPLLKSRPPFLCESCHNGPHASSGPFGTSVGGVPGVGQATTSAPNINAVGRACLNCHVMVHGSNSPAGAYLHR